MTDAVAHLTTFVSSTASRCRRVAALLGRSPCRLIIARATRRALKELPDGLLEEFGVRRSDIVLVASELVRRYDAPARDVLDRSNGTGAEYAARRRPGWNAQPFASRSWWS